MSIKDEFTKGFWEVLPPFRLVLGLCPVLAVTTTGINGMGMGLATTFVLVFSNLFVSLLRRFIPSQVRIASEAFASKNNPIMSLADGLGIGLGFTISLFVLGCLRELLGNGTLLDIPVMWSSFEPFTFMLKPPGAFVALGVLLAAMNLITQVQARKGGGR
jgi:electron transport complex protein RnfE